MGFFLKKNDKIFAQEIFAQEIFAQEIFAQKKDWQIHLKTSQHISLCIIGSEVVDITHSHTLTHTPTTLETNAKQ
jgi:hypothetical protein